MIITRVFGRWAPGTAADAQDLVHWRDDNAVLCASTRHARFPVVESPLSIKTAAGAAIELVVNGRRVMLDDDHYQVFNAGDLYSSSIDSERPMQAFCVYFRPGLAEEVAAGLRQDLDAALEQGSTLSPGTGRWPVAFSGHLRTHDDEVTPALRHIHANVVAGCTEADWYEEAFQDLLVRLMSVDAIHRRVADRFDAAKRGTREELLRRIGWATDFINSNYMDPIVLDDIARAASLSKFHLARLFKLAMGITPHNYLQHKRTQVAHRLLDTTDSDIGDIAQACGFGSRWTMYRFLRRSFGAGGRRLRGESSRP